MGSRCIAALILLGLLCTGFAGAEVVVDCCLTTTDKFFPLMRISHYRLQEEGKGCDISATIFFTKASRTVCIVHPEDKHKKTKWVKSHIEKLDAKRNQQQE